MNQIDILTSFSIISLLKKKQSNSQAVASQRIRVFVAFVDCDFPQILPSREDASWLTIAQCLKTKVEECQKERSATSQCLTMFSNALYLLSIIKLYR